MRRRYQDEGNTGWIAVAEWCALATFEILAVPAGWFAWMFFGEDL